MIRLITVEREYGSRGAEFAHHLARHLGWKLIDECLIEEIAQKAGISKKLAQRCDERLDPWYYRYGKAFWHGSLERLPALPESEVFDSQRMVEFVREYLLKVAEEGHCRGRRARRSLCARESALLLPRLRLRLTMAEGEVVRGALPRARERRRAGTVRH